MQNNDNQKTYFIYVRSTGEKVPVTKAQHDSFYKEATASAIRSRITAGVCAPIVLFGSAMVTASAANTMRQATLLLWINLSLMATALLAIIFPTAVNRWKKSSPTAYSQSSFLPDCVSSTRRPIPSSSFGRITRKASPTVPLQESSVARRKPSRIR